MEKKEPTDPVLTEEELKKQKKKEAKQLKKKIQKFQKKIAQLSKTLTKKEKKPLEQIFSENQTQKLILMHFGTGSQEDKECIKTLLNSLGIEDYLLNVYPGYFHSHLEISKAEDVSVLVESFLLVEHEGLSLHC